MCLGIKTKSQPKTDTKLKVDPSDMLRLKYQPVTEV